MEEPIFVKELTCSADMDAEVEFITNNNFKLKAVDIEIPYYDELTFIKDITIAGKTPSEITKDDPLVVEKGHTYMLGYTADTTVPTEYGTMFIECKIIGTDSQGNEHINMFYIKGNENRVFPEWILEQIDKNVQ